MTTAVERIREEARQLPYEEREALVRVLEIDLDSTAPSDATPAEVETLWDGVVLGRIADIESSKVKLIPLEEVELEMDAFVAGLSKA